MTTKPLTPEQKQLVQAWMSMAHGVAKGFWERSGKTLPLDELVSAAYHGLVQAAQKFEFDRATDERYETNAGFGNYARMRVKGAILDWQRSQDHVPRRQRQTYKKLQEAGHGTGRTPEELSDLTGIDVEKVRAIVQAVESGAVSLDDSWGGNDADSGTHVESTAMVSHVSSKMAGVIESFSPVQGDVVIYRVYSGWEFPAIAAELGISVTTARTLYFEAMLVVNSVLRDVAHT